MQLRMKEHWPLYLMVLPGVLFFVIFRYIPLAGLIISFQDYSIFKGVFGSPWAGMKHFEALFGYEEFWRVFRNTALIGFYMILFTFPAPIVLALLINELRHLIYKRVVQTVFYIPHFFSWVIIAGLTFDLLSNQGLINNVRGFFGLEPVLYMQKEGYFRTIVILTQIWRDSGWGTIVLLAAISSINPEIYESAMMDGAGRFRRIISMTLPLMMPTVTVLFLLNIGSFLDLGFDHIYNLLTPMTYQVGDVFDTYVFRTGINQGQYSGATAVGLFQSVIGLILVIVFNKLAKRYSEDGGVW